MSHPLKRRFISSDEAVATKSQHKKPCADCPFARTAMNGWLGSSIVNRSELATPEEWLQRAHGESYEICHCTKNQQCAGLAIFRANVIKLPRVALVLPQDKKLVFANDAEFIAHHKRKLKKA